jgi:hypothetical protein
LWIRPSSPSGQIPPEFTDKRFANSESFLAEKENIECNQTIVTSFFFVNSRNTIVTSYLEDLLDLMRKGKEDLLDGLGLINGEL